MLGAAMRFIKYTLISFKLNFISSSLQFSNVLVELRKRSNMNMNKKEDEIKNNKMIHKNKIHQGHKSKILFTFNFIFCACYLSKVTLYYTILYIIFHYFRFSSFWNCHFKVDMKFFWNLSSFELFFYYLGVTIF